MKKIFSLVSLLIFPLYFKAQSVNIDSLFPANGNRSLWDYVLMLNDSSQKPIADSLLDYTIKKTQTFPSSEGDFLILNRLALFYGNSCSNTSKFKYVLDTTETLYHLYGDTASYAYADYYRTLALYHKEFRKTDLILEAFEKAHSTLLIVDDKHPARPAYEHNLMQARFMKRKIEAGFQCTEWLIAYALQEQNYYYLASAYLGAANIIKFYNPELSVRFFDYAHFIANYYKLETFLNDPFFYISLGSGQTAVSNHKKALSLFHDGLNLLNLSGNDPSHLKPSFYYYIGVSYKNMKQNDEALCFLDSALLAERKNTSHYYRILHIKGETLGNAKRYNEALVIQEAVLPFFIETYGAGNTYFTQQAYNDLVRSLQGLGRYTEALQISHKSICLFLETNDTSDIWSVPDVSLNMTAKKNYMSLEYALYRKTSILQDMYLQTRDTALPNLIFYHFDAATKAADIQASLAQTLPTLLDISDRLKFHANTLLDFVFEAGLNTSYATPAHNTMARSKAYGLMIEQLRNKNGLTENTSKKRKLEEELLYVNQVTDSSSYLNLMANILHLEQEEFLAHLSIPKSKLTNIPLIADLSSPYNRNIDENSIVLDYYVTKKHICTFTCAQNNINAFATALPEDFSDMGQSLFKAIKLSETQNIKRYSDKLGDLLLKNINLKNTGHVTIVADEKLHIIPFELITYKGKKLIEQFNISYRYNAPNYKHLTKNEKPSSFTGFAPVFNDSLPSGLANYYRFVEAETDSFDSHSSGKQPLPLLATQTEIAGIADFYLKNNLPATLFSGTHANKNVFLKSLTETGILHIATHAVSNNSNPSLSGLFLYGPNYNENLSESFVCLSEINNLQVNASLVVLSACKSGYGAILRGEGIMGLSRGFIAAGAGHVLASLWKVHDERTMQFMLSFYKYVFEGYTYAQALQKTKLLYIKKGWPATDWAGFILVEGA